MSAFEVEAARQLVRGMSWDTWHGVTVVKHSDRPLRWRHHGLGAKFLGDVMLTRAYADSDYSAGTRYWIPRRVFHTTEVDGLAITIVHRSNFDDRLARVLCAPDSDVSAVSGIVRDESAEHRALVEAMLREAAATVAKL